MVGFDNLVDGDGSNQNQESPQFMPTQQLMEFEEDELQECNNQPD